jgi:hypothetical protein
MLGRELPWWAVCLQQVRWLRKHHLHRDLAAALLLTVLCMFSCHQPVTSQQPALDCEHAAAILQSLSTLRMLLNAPLRAEGF